MTGAWRRLGVAILLALLLIALCVYGATASKRLPLKELLDHPERYSGQEVSLSLRVQEVGDRYVLRDLYDNVQCQARGRQAQDGTQVTAADVGLRIDLWARFYAPATLETIEAYVARGRTDKIIASLAALGWVAALVVLHFRPRREVRHA